MYIEMKKSITILLAALLCACGFPIDKAEWTRAEEICAKQELRWAPTWWVKATSEVV